MCNVNIERSITEGRVLVNRKAQVYIFVYAEPHMCSSASTHTKFSYIMLKSFSTTRSTKQLIPTRLQVEAQEIVTSRPN